MKEGILIKPLHELKLKYISGHFHIKYILLNGYFSFYFPELFSAGSVASFIKLTSNQQHANPLLIPS